MQNFKKNVKFDKHGLSILLLANQLRTDIISKKCKQKVTISHLAILVDNY